MPTSTAVPVGMSPDSGQDTDFPNTILQTLESWIPNQTAENAIFYPKEPFLENLKSWDGCPLVFQKDGVHPNIDLFATDPEKALEEIGGEWAGKLLDPRLEMEGQPRLMGNLRITLKKAIELWESGNLSPSTAFGCDAINVEGKRRIVGGVKPSHILLFPRDKALPADKGSFILNTEMADGENVNATNAIQAAVTNLVAAIKSNLSTQNSTEITAPPTASVPTVNTVVPQEDTMELEKIQKENSEQKAIIEKLTADCKNATAELEKLKTDLANTEKKKLELEATIAEIKKQENDAKWAAIKNSLLPGMVATPEDEAKWRDMATNKPLDFATEIAKVKIANATKKEGTETTTPGSEYLKIRQDFIKASGGKAV